MTKSSRCRINKTRASLLKFVCVTILCFHKIDHSISLGKLFCRIEVYFDNNTCKKKIQPIDLSEVNWFYNGIQLKPSQKFNMIKQRELAILQINRITHADKGVYTIQATSKTNEQPTAALNIDGKLCFCLRLLGHSMQRANDHENGCLKLLTKRSKSNSMRTISFRPKKYGLYKNALSEVT